MKRPGLIVLVLVLAAALAWLFFRGDSQAADRGTGETAKTPAGTADQKGERSDLRADPATVAGEEARKPLPGQPVYALRGEVLDRPEASIEGAFVVAYEGKPNDRRLSMSSIFSAIDESGSVDMSKGLFRQRLGKPLARATVAADGTFELRELPSRHLRLIVEHRFYALDQPTAVHIDSKRQTSIVLRPYFGGHIVGRVEPYSAALSEGTRSREPSVRLISEMDPMFMIRNPQDFTGYMMNSIARDADLDAQGRFELRAVVPSNAIYLTYHGADKSAELGPLGIRPGQSREVVLHPEAGGAVELTIRGDGAPIEGAGVRLNPKEGKGTYYQAYTTLKARSDDSGRCEIPTALAGRYRVEVSAGGFLDASREIDVQTGETARVVVDLERGASVQGIVVDGRHEPVAGAKVRYLPDPKIPIIGDLTKLTGEDILIESARSSRIETDAEGRFTLSGIADDEPFAVVAWHADFGGGLTRGVTEGQIDVTIKMLAPCEITGRVVDDVTGEPIADFTAATMVRMMMVMERSARKAVIADSVDGAFALQRVPVGSAASSSTSAFSPFGSPFGVGKSAKGSTSLTIRIQAAGYADLRHTVKATAGASIDAGELRMHRDGVIRGVVLLPSGQPAPGVMVGPKAVGMLDNPILLSMSDNPACTTDQRGRFELTGLPPGHLRLKATSNTFASGVTKRMRIAAGQVIDDVEIRLGEGGTIVGRLELPESMATEGWMVMVSNNLGGSMRSETPDAEGRFRFEGVDPGKYDVQAMATDWMRSMQSERSEMFRPGGKVDFSELIQATQDKLVRTRCRVKASETTEVVLDGGDLGEDGVELKILVTLGKQQMPMGWIEIEQIGSASSGGGGAMKLSVIENGLAKIGSVQPGELRLTVRTGMTMTPVGEAVTISVPKAKSHTAKVVLPGGRAEGKVVDEANGEPMTGAVVRIVSAQGSETDQVEELGFAITDKEGRFAFEGLADGRYSLFANDSFFNLGNKRHGGRLDNVRIQSGGTVEKIVLKTTQAARATVRVADLSDAPAARAMVLAVDPDGKPLSILPTFTDSAGRATLGGLPPGRVRVVAMTRALVPGYSPVEEIQTGRETKFVVTMSRGPRVKVRIENQEGKVVLGARLSARWRQGPWIPISLVQRFEPKTGHLDLGHLPAGAVEFRVHSTGTRAFIVKRDLPAGPSAELVFTAPK